MIVEIGNRYGGSALYLAHFLDALAAHDAAARGGGGGGGGGGEDGGEDDGEPPFDCRLICVDIDHSDVAPAARAHPRVAAWIEASVSIALHHSSAQFVP